MKNDLRLINKPSLADALYAQKNDIFTQFNCHRVGIIQELDATSFTATIQIVDNLVKDTYNGTVQYPFPPLAGVPVFMPCDVDKGLTFPIGKGTECLVLFNDRDIDRWFSNGQVQKPNSARMHSLSDGLAIVGFRSLLRPLTNYNAAATELKYGNTLVSLDDKVKIQNATKNLKTLIDSFINVIKALQVVDPISGNLSITAATTTALNNIKTEFDALLK
jgi:hypothetical protein